MFSLENNLMGSTSTIPLQVMTSTESLRANGGLERNKGCWHLLKHNWRQLSSLVPGLILLAATGSLHTSWTIWQLFIYLYEFTEVKIDLMLAWYVGVVGGSMFGAFLNSNWSKMCIYYSTAMALLPTSLVLVVHRTSPYNFLLIARSLTGILFGLTLTTLVLHIADNSSQYIRRYFIWSITIVTMIPTVLFADIVSYLTNIADIHIVTGILMFAMGVLALILMPCTYESIIFLLETGKDLKALQIMHKLRNESRHYIRRDFNEFKMMLTEDFSDGFNILANGNLRPLSLILLIRLLSPLLANSFVSWMFMAHAWFDYRNWHAGLFVIDAIVPEIESPSNYTQPLSEEFPQNNTFNQNSEYANGTWFNTTFANVTESPAFIDSWDSSSSLFDFNSSFGNEDLLVEGSNVTTSSIIDYIFIHSSYMYQLPALQPQHILLIVFLIKLLVGIPLTCFAEKFTIYRNRFVFKATLIVSTLNFIFFTFTSICYRIDDSSLIFTFYMGKLLNGVNGVYLLIAFSIDTIGYIELAEAFSLTKRYGCIAFIIIAEHCVHILMIVLLMHSVYRFYFHLLQSAAIIVICYLLLYFMPNECLNRTLRGARDKYFVKASN